MTLKIFGALLIVSSCGTFGFIMVCNHRKEVFALEQLITAMDYMQSELQYNLTDLPELSRKIVGITRGVVQKTFQNYLKELELQISPDSEKCMHTALQRTKDIPAITRSCIESMARTLGKFDLEGQERSLISLRHMCQRKLEDYTKNQQTRLRSYQTLAICAGAALTILFI